MNGARARNGGGVDFRRCPGAAIPVLPFEGLLPDLGRPS